MSSPSRMLVVILSAAGLPAMNACAGGRGDAMGAGTAGQSRVA